MKDAAFASRSDIAADEERKIPTLKAATDAEIAADTRRKADARAKPLDDAGAMASRAGAGGAGQALGGAASVAVGLATANPVQVVMGAMDVIEGSAKQMAEGLNAATHAILLFGDLTAKIAGNDYLGAFEKSTEAASKTLHDIPLIGAIWGAEFDLAIAPVKAFTQVVGSFVDRGKELAKYSGAISAAQAGNEVRDIMADLKEEQALGEGIAALTTSSNEIQQELRAFFLPIKRAIIDLLVPIMEQLLVVTKNSSLTLNLVYELLKIAFEAASALLDKKLDKVAEIVGSSADRIAKLLKKDDGDPLTILNSFYDMLRQDNLPGAPVKAPGQRGLRIPVVPQ